MFFLDIATKFCYNYKKREKVQMKKQSSGVGPLDAAFKYLTPKARTVREVETYLDSCNYGEYEVYAAVERLKELGYLNDEQYANEFIRTRLNTKPVSRAHLYRQLKEHMLSDEVISTALNKLSSDDELKNAVAVASKFYGQFAELDEHTRMERTRRRLISRGFSYSDIRRALELISSDASVINDLIGDDVNDSYDE